jgi:hypothetical protein
VKKGFSIEIASISDVHLGHTRTPTQLITENLDIAFPDNAQFAKLDMIFIDGDFFDRLLQVPEDDAYIARRWIHRFLLRCEKHDVALAVLEGTPRHDRRQSKMFQEVIDLTGVKVDFRYVDSLSIEYIERFDIHVLYVPDEWRHDPNETFAEVQALMAAKMLTQVDFASMHGCFEYQLPDVGNARQKAHQSANYLPLVRHQIFIGHHHVFSEYEHIVAQGSFDRLIHGEEAPKGHVRLSIKDGAKTLTFVENKGAMDYRTLSVSGMSVEEVLVMIAALKLRPDSRIRLTGAVSDMGIRMLRHIRRDFPEYKIISEVDKVVGGKLEAPTVARHYVPIQIGPANVIGMARDWMVRDGANDHEIKYCEEIIHEQISSGIGR